VTVNDAPIGIFDSGVGGLTVARAIIDQLPNESIIYVGDTANSPYGPKSIQLVRELALGVMDRLVDEGVKVLVIACNSASAAVLRDARERYTVGRGIPVVEVIQPAVRRAVAATRNHKVGVIGTNATITSRAYDDAFAAAVDLQITSAACPAFVDFVENGITSAISYVMGDEVTLVSSAEETAKDVYRTLVAHNLLRTSTDAPTLRFQATGDAKPFGRLARRFLGPEVTNVEHLPNDLTSSHAVIYEVADTTAIFITPENS
jgi:glutamate racemase